MIDLKQIVHLKWTTRNKKYYENKGYNYTYIGDNLDIILADLPLNSNERVSVMCDCSDCKNPNVITPYRNYNRIVNDNGLYRCKLCTFTHSMKLRDDKSHERLFKLFLDKCKEHDCVPITTINDFGGSKSKVKYICPFHGIQETTMNNISGSDAWCYWCGKDSMKLKNKNTYEYVKEFIEAKNNNICLNPEEYIDTKTRNLKIKCGSCGDVFITSFASIYNGNGHCKKCGDQICRSFDYTYTYEWFKENIIINNKIVVKKPDSFVSIYEPMIFYCSECGEQYHVTPYYYLVKGYTLCKKCSKSISHGESEIKQYLDIHNINYVYQKSFENCKDVRMLPFDFYIPSKNIIIEYDGEQHYKPVECFGGLEAYLKTKEHDNIKNNYCLNNSIKLIRIPYWDFNDINKILEIQLN